MESQPDRRFLRSFVRRGKSYHQPSCCELQGEPQIDRERIACGIAIGQIGQRRKIGDHADAVGPLRAPALEMLEAVDIMAFVRAVRRQPMFDACPLIPRLANVTGKREEEQQPEAGRCLAQGVWPRRMQDLPPAIRALHGVADAVAPRTPGRSRRLPHRLDPRTAASDPRPASNRGACAARPRAHGSRGADMRGADPGWATPYLPARRMRQADRFSARIAGVWKGGPR